MRGRCTFALHDFAWYSNALGYLAVSQVVPPSKPRKRSLSDPNSINNSNSNRIPLRPRIVFQCQVFPINVIVHAKV